MKNEAPSLRRLANAWERFFFQPCRPEVCAAFRIGFALLLLVNSFGYYLHLEMWFGESGVLPYDVSREVIDSDTLTIFTWLPKTALALWTCFVIFNLQIVGLLVGLFARFQAMGVFLWLVSFQHRNQLIADGEDTVFRLFAFLLIFLPLADSFSVDALLRSRRGHKPRLQPRPAWALRLIQIQMVLIFWATAWEKLRGEEWVDGTALYYVARVEDLFGRFPMPGIFFEWMPAIQVMTWSVLLIELMVPVLIWFRETRTFTIAAVVLFHLGIDYTMNLFLFEWLMILGWLTFVTPDDLRALQRAWAALKNRFAALLDDRVTAQQLAGGDRIGVSQASRKS